MNHETIPDRELLEAIARKDVNAFNSLYHKYNKLLLEKAYLRLRDIARTEEVMQDFWIDIWTQPDRVKYGPDGDARAFMLNYLLFRVLDFFRGESANAIALANSKTLESVENELSYAHVSEEYDIKELESVIQDVLKDFPGRTGEIFMMLHRDGYTVKETSQILKINERTIKYKVKQALDALKRIMK
ncbi:MAG: RNA polymerase sigma factor [Odoribacteraceae bacterium]|jgi:RNA polymerase sigma-70 factor (ECF subfamily)|nr:RNA polymerase sigma factor [Odoribacteraceae bacterium]